MTQNALDSALVELAAASTAMERTANPGIKDVEEAKEKAKKAFKILEAAHQLLSFGIYTVTAEPGPAAAPSTPMFDPAGQPSPEAVIEETPALPPLPDELQAWDETDEADQILIFERHLTDLGQGFDEAVDWSPWDEAWTADPKDAFTRLLVAEAREEKTPDVPTDEERDTWLAGFAAPEPPAGLPTLPDLLNGFLANHPAFRLQRFNDGLSTLLDAAVETTEDWPVPWRNAYDENPVDTFTRLTYAVEHRIPASVAFPTDEEMAAFTAQFAPAAPEFDQATLFAGKLAELEKIGAAEGLKPRSWKKAAKAWQAEFDADPIKAFNKLIWALEHRVEISWEVPTDEQVA